MSGKKSYSFEHKWYSVHEFMSKTKAERKNEGGKKSEMKRLTPSKATAAPSTCKM